MLSNYARLVSGLILVAALSACSSGPPPKLYLLEVPVSDSPSTPELQGTIKSLGISLVTLPGYATDERISSVDANGVVSQMDSQRWAEEPEEAITRVFAQRLKKYGASIVLQEPWPRDYSPRARVEVKFGRLLREEHGGASVSGYVQLLSGDGRSLLQLVPFEFAVLGESTGSREYFRAVGTAIDAIARTSIEALIALDADA